MMTNDTFSKVSGTETEGSGYPQHWKWLSGISWAVVLSLVVLGTSVTVATLLTRQPEPAFDPAPVLASR